MNKNEIQKIISFIGEVEKLPDVLLTDKDTSAFIADDATEEDKQKVYLKETELFEKVRNLKIRLIAYFRAVQGENSTYIDLLGGITFKTKGFVVNTIHFENNKAWSGDKSKLLNLLKMARTEFEEKARIASQSPDNSFLHFLKTKEAKAIILTALLAILTGVLTKDIWSDKLFHEPTEDKTYIAQLDSISNSQKMLLDLDKKNVLDKTVKEVFTNYYKMIETLQMKYASTSAIGYFDDYLKKEITNIEGRISNRSYIHRFAERENLWSEKDFNQVSTILTSKTISRIKEISEDMESKSQGPFIFSDDKLKQLKEAAKK
jgi:hypothetical protein